LNEVIKSTPPQHEDFESIKQAYSILKSDLTEMNGKIDKSSQDEDSSLLQLRNRFLNESGNVLMKHGRKLLMEEKLTVVEKSEDEVCFFFYFPFPFPF